MKFEYREFSCDIDIFKKGDDILVRFYDKEKEQKEKDIVNLVIVEPGFGYISLKFKGKDGLMGGFLRNEIFADESMVDAAIDFVESLSPKSEDAYIPHHIDLVSTERYVEYNGEY